MRDPDRIPEIINAIFTVWQKNPNLRLGQLIMNAAAHGGRNVKDVFYVDDDIMVIGLKKMIEGDKK